MKTCYLSKITEREKRSHTLEKTVVIHISNKRLTSEYLKNSYKVNKQRNKISRVRKSVLNEYFIKKNIQMANGKVFDTSLPTRNYKLKPQ